MKQTQKNNMKTENNNENFLTVSKQVEKNAKKSIINNVLFIAFTCLIASLILSAIFCNL